MSLLASQGSNTLNGSMVSGTGNGPTLNNHPFPAMNGYNRFPERNNHGQQHLSSSADRFVNLNETQESELLNKLIPFRNYGSRRLLSFLYSDHGEGFTSTSTTTVAFPIHSDYPDYDEIIKGIQDDSVQDAFVEGSHLWSLLVVGYSIVFLVGVVGNTMLLAALCGTGGRARSLPVRNHLMVNLATADLLVTAICVPVSACASAGHACWPNFLVSWMCHLGPILQRTPVTASTLSLALLSLDRYLAIRHPRFAQRFRERRFVAMSMAIIWILAALVAAPTFWAREWDSEASDFLWSSDEQKASPQDEMTGENIRTNSSSWTKPGVCVERWTNIAVHLTYVATYLGTAFVSPALIVAACHASVSHKLTTQLRALSGATSGDRSRQRPTQVLIVARDPSNNIIPNPMNPPINNPYRIGSRSRNASPSRSGSLDCPPRPTRKFVPCDPDSDDEDDVYVRMQIEADLASLRQMSEYQKNLSKSGGNRRGVKSFTTFRSQASVPTASNNNMLKASKRESSIIRAHRKLRKKLNVSTGVPTLAKPLSTPMPILPTYSSQSFRSRKRAATLLGALAAVFVCCWAPYVACALLEMFLKDKSWVRLVIPFSLFLGHAHSAINPVVSWRLNRSAFVRFQRQPMLSFLPEWLRTFTACRTFCFAFNCPSPRIWFRKWREGVNNQTGNSVPPSVPGVRRPPLRRTGTRYPGMIENRNPFVNTPQRDQRRGSSSWCTCCGGDESDDVVPCCCCFCPSGVFTRRSSSPDLWNRNTSTNEAALGAFHPKYLSRLPAPDPISRCHTSHFLR